LAAILCISALASFAEFWHPPHPDKPVRRANDPTSRASIDPPCESKEMIAMAVYTWIRESVRKAVLMGFNDAIEQIGPPTEEKPLNEHLSAVLNKAPALTSAPASSSTAAAITAGEIAAESTSAFEAPPIAARPRRKRLGRSLEQIQQGSPKAA
jgi:hypothetical protein